MNLEQKNFKHKCKYNLHYFKANTTKLIRLILIRTELEDLNLISFAIALPTLFIFSKSQLKLKSA